MLRFPLLLALLLSALVLSAGAAPAFAADAPAHAVVASDDEWGDEGDWGDDEEAGEDWSDVDCADEDGEPLPAEECIEDDWVCDDEWEDWSDEEIASDDEWADAAVDEWADDDEDWSDEDCAEEAEEVAPPRLTALRATPARRNTVKVSFKLDRKGTVVLSLRRVGGARTSGRGRSRGAARGTVNVAGRRGANATTLRRWKGRALAPGSYRLTATPATGRAATTTFTLRVAPRSG
jgi:hypothetical protein